MNSTTTQTTVTFSPCGYLPGVYSISIEGDEFAALWEECTALDKALSVANPAESLFILEQWRPLKVRANATALAALEDSVLEAYLVDDPIGLELTNRPDEKDYDGPIIPWAERFTYRHPFSSAQEMAGLIKATGWDGPIVIDTPFMEDATALQITEHEFCLV